MKKTIAALLLSLPLINTTALAATDNDVCKAKENAMALSYQQQSGEITALQIQTYAFATERFKQILRDNTSTEKMAVVLDLDETVIDNSPLLVRDMNNCHDFTAWDTWNDWEQKGQPTLIPGAKTFLDYVNTRDVKIFYVSDRFQKNKADTLNSLNALNLPQVSSDNVLLLTGSKEVRRASIRENYNIIMLFGDSLADFDAAFKNKKSTEYQRNLVKQQSEHLGKDWFVLPNASYGSWMQAPLTSWDEK
ncbi:5'-nucleotidase, lipoprotein e(P4) family [Shewanella surugensis]|uniref:5'-nucleotidase, lipoprotein e(P4) family n=1 Tax=Shewanella surugensis TaxID=212020 RepID=A0ABT0LJ08_9GAMM|nr:5'-nucleotidase, lipoprotein e(P4) family [Shewanella surugensis]MCL1127676.1 5'-nucleotidase, lipoprotein e(P4) family [Shewanella surugensis]